MPQLKQRIETGLDIELPLDSLMQKLSLVDLAAQLLAQLYQSSRVSGSPLLPFSDFTNKV